MVPIVMEPRCLNPQSWKGVVGGKLGSKLYINMASDEDAAFAECVERIVKEIDEIQKSYPARLTAAGRRASALDVS